MIKIEIDENNYLTGNWASIGGNDDWIEVEELPTNDRVKLRAYEYENNEFIFDEDKYNTLLEDSEKRKKIAESITETKKIKETLSASDYKVIKNIESIMSDMLRLLSTLAEKLDVEDIDKEKIPYDVDLIHSERQELRDKINELEK